MKFPQLFNGAKDRLRTLPVEAKIFLFAGLVSLPIFMILSAPMQVPDESYHYWRSYEISNFDIMADAHDNGRFGYTVPVGVRDFAEGLTDNINPKARLDFQEARALGAIKNPEAVQVNFENAAIYSPVVYLPQSVGIGLVRLVHGSLLTGFYVGRIFNYLTWLGLCALALAIAPYGRKILLVIAFLPMSIYTAASLSPDGIIISLSMLTVALFLKSLTIRSYSRNFLLVPILLAALLALTKNGYFLLAFPFLLLPKKRFPNAIAYYIWMFSMLIIPALLSVLWGHAVLDIAETIHAVLRPGIPINTQEQLAVITANPLRYVGVILNTFLLKSGSLLAMSAIGVFGWLDIVLPFVFYLVVPAMVVLATQQEGAPRLSVPRSTVRIGLAAASVLAVLVIVTSLYVGYTSIGLGYIEGLQGRYFIPLLFALGAYLATFKRTPTISERRFVKITTAYVVLTVVTSAFALLNANVLRIGY